LISVECDLTPSLAAPPNSKPLAATGTQAPRVSWTDSMISKIAHVHGQSASSPSKVSAATAPTAPSQLSQTRKLSSTSEDDDSEYSDDSDLTMSDVSAKAKPKAKLASAVSRKTLPVSHRMPKTLLPQIQKLTVYTTLAVIISSDDDSG